MLASGILYIGLFQLSVSIILLALFYIHIKLSMYNSSEAYLPWLIYLMVVPMREI